MKNTHKEPTWKYIVAWICCFGLANLLVLGLGQFFQEYVIDELISVENYLMITAISNLPFFLISAFLIYEKVFPKLNIYKVWRWFLGLGTFLVISATGNSVSEIRDLVGNENYGLYVYTPLFLWFISLLLFRYYFKKIKGVKWGEEV